MQRSSEDRAKLSKTAAGGEAEGPTSASNSGDPHRQQQQATVCSTSPPEPIPFLQQQHIRYYVSLLKSMPSQYASLDPQRLTVLHFCVHALDLLGVWDDTLLQENLQLSKAQIIDWIYSLQNDNPGGFLGSSCCGSGRKVSSLAATYCALACLKVLGDDDWSSNRKRLARVGIIEFLKQQQASDGCFRAYQNQEGEADMRFVYCACAISYMLDDWSGIDIPKVVEYIKRCRAYDGAIALIPNQEGHGGSTYCAVASLVLMNQLDQVMDDKWKSDLIYWCVHRQVRGMQGRPNKKEDTCYSFWIGGTLRLLQKDDLLDHGALQHYILSNQHTKIGGFCKCREAPYPDILHAFFSISWLGMAVKWDGQGNQQQLPLQLANAALGIRHDRVEAFRGDGGDQIIPP
jgi:geranylgeranyl transferase type-1 subunit beta